VTDELSNEKQIVMFMHCGLCVLEVKELEGVSPEEYSRINAGWTKLGIQLWCTRHNCNVANIDFEGHTHPADTSI